MNPLFQVMALQCLMIGDAVADGDSVMALMVASILLGCITVQAMGV